MSTGKRSRGTVEHPHSRGEATEDAVAKRRKGAAKTTSSSSFVHYQMHKLKEGQEGAPRNRRQGIAIGLSEARKAGVGPQGPGGKGGGAKSGRTRSGRPRGARAKGKRSTRAH